jgi:hypothetical protein
MVFLSRSQGWLTFIMVSFVVELLLFRCWFAYHRIGAGYSSRLGTEFSIIVLVHDVEIKGGYQADKWHIRLIQLKSTNNSEHKSFIFKNSIVPIAGPPSYSGE